MQGSRMTMNSRRGGARNASNSLGRQGAAAGSENVQPNQGVGYDMKSASMFQFGGNAMGAEPAKLEG